MHVIGGGLYRFPSRRRLGWAALLARVFAVDVMLCTTCGGRLRLVAVMSDPASMRLQPFLYSHERALKVGPFRYSLPGQGY